MPQLRTALALGAASALALGLLGGTPSARADVVATPGSGPITINDAGSATPYPAVVEVEGVRGTITDVDLTLEDFNHTFSDDVDVLLVSPTGTQVVPLSDACGEHDFVDADLTFDDEAAAAMPSVDPSDGTCAGTSYRPSAYEDHNDTWPAAHPGPHGSVLGAFDGEDPNGEWRLYVSDDTEGDAGAIEQGFTLRLTTDYEPPTTTITSKPSRRTEATRARIAFRSDVPDAKFQCRVDAHRWKACTSPLRLTRLKPGRHVVQVRARDAYGTADRTPATARWRVLRRR